MYLYTCIHTQLLSLHLVFILKHDYNMHFIDKSLVQRFVRDWWIMVCNSSVRNINCWDRAIMLLQPRYWGYDIYREKEIREERDTHTQKNKVYVFLSATNTGHAASKISADHAVNRILRLILYPQKNSIWFRLLPVWRPTTPSGRLVGYGSVQDCSNSRALAIELL